MIEPQEYNPQETKPTTELINQLIPGYTQAKKTFFMYASKTDDEEAGQIAGEQYGILIDFALTLLELCKADNINQIETITFSLKKLRDMNKLISVTDEVIQDLEDLTTWIDINPLNSYLRTQPQLMSCNYNTHTPA